MVTHILFGFFFFPTLSFLPLESSVVICWWLVLALVVSRVAEVISKFSLARVIEVWNHRVHGCIYYAFRPAWVHVPITEAFFTLHPEQRKFRTMMEAKRRDEELMRIWAEEQ